MTDDLTHDHLRALLAEQTARAERAEVDYRRVLSERAAANQLAGRCAQQRDHALAACAEMRAALTEIIARGQEQRGTGRMIETAEAALARTDLGAGWASPEVVAQMVGALQMVEGDGEFDSLHEVTRKFVVDVLALLKKGGG